MILRQGGGVFDNVSEGMGWLEGRDDPLLKTAQLERFKGFGVRRRYIGDAPLFAEPGVFRTDAWIIEPAEIEWPSII